MAKINIGKSIQICLKEQEKTRTEGAKYLGVSLAWFSTISNHPNTGARYIDDLSEFFGISPTVFIAKGQS